MSNYTTYLLGAGASAKAIFPYSGNAGSNFSSGFRSFVNIFFESENDSILVPNEIKSNIVEIRNEGCACPTLDLYARRLYLKNTPDSFFKLNLLKSLIAFYITYEQFFRPTNYNKLDVRYENFLAAILEPTVTNPRINSNVKIISWNYDNQLEIALQKFIDSKYSLDGILKDYKFYPRNNFLSSEESNIIKLNGSAGIYCKRTRVSKIGIRTISNSEYKKEFDQVNEIDYLHNNLELKDINDFKENLTSCFLNHSRLAGDDYQDQINFAWETENNISCKAKEEAIKILSNTQKLIVIGYSFPGFNYEVDSLLLRNLLGDSKVLYQSTDTNSEYACNKVKANFIDRIRNNSVKHTAYCDNFLLPEQMEQYFL